MAEWQLECLNSRAFLSGENFLLSLPTSGGKVRYPLLVHSLLSSPSSVLSVFFFVRC